MQEKQNNEHGKDEQTDRCPHCNQTVDRSQDYKRWVRTVNTGKNGYWVDIDLLKVHERNGQTLPVAITDITYAKSHAPAYLAAIQKRWFQRDSQGQTFRDLAAFFGVPCYLVAFGQGSVSVLDVLNPQEWDHYSLEEWGQKVDEL